MLDLNKHVVNNEKPFHSSGFAKIAGGGSFGATSLTSFEKRQQIDSNRKTILGYNRSTIANSYHEQRKSYVTNKLTNFKSPVQNSPTGAVAPSTNLQKFNSVKPVARKININ